MRSYLVEAYLPRSTDEERRRMVERARVVVADMRAEGADLRYVRSIFLPQDETCFHCFEAASDAEVEEVARRARFTAHRIVEAIE
jgi:hypothetical protein